MASLLTLSGISKVFAEPPAEPVTALDGVSLEVFSGEIFVFLGPSGSGKSTLLRIMSGLETASSGAVRFSEGISRADFSFVFQQFALLPWLTVSENIGLGLLARGMKQAERNQIVTRELVLFGLEKFAPSRPHELSGGMRQRVGIARALATDPKVIFMDEPFSELDSFTASALRKELLAIWYKRRSTIVMVSHNIEEALELADRIAVLTSRPGRIEKIIPNPLARPRHKRSQEFYRLEDELSQLLRP